MRSSIVWSSGCWVSVIAGIVHDSNELLPRASSSALKLKDLEGYDGFRILPRELDEYDNFVILPRVLTRAQRQAQDQDGGNNHGLGIAGGGVQATAGIRGRGDYRAGRGGNAGRGRARAGLGHGGRGQEEPQPPQAAQIGPNNGANPAGQAPPAVPQALHPILSRGQVRARTASIPRILRGMQIARGARGGRLVGGRQWMYAGIDLRNHDPGLTDRFRQRTHVAQAVAQVASGEGEFHSVHGSRLLHPGQWAANKRQTPIPHTTPSSPASVNTWDAHTASVGINLRSDQPGPVRGRTITTANGAVRTELHMVPGTQGQLTTNDGITNTQIEFSSQGPARQTVTTRHHHGLSQTITHLTELNGPGQVDSTAIMAPPPPIQPPGQVPAAVPIRPQNQAPGVAALLRPQAVGIGAGFPPHPQDPQPRPQ